MSIINRTFNFMLYYFEKKIYSKGRRRSWGEERRKDVPHFSFWWWSSCPTFDPTVVRTWILFFFDSFTSRKGDPFLVTEGIFVPSSSCSPCVIHTGYLCEWIRSLSFFRSDEGKRVEKVRPFFSTALPSSKCHLYSLSFPSSPEWSFPFHFTSLLLLFSKRFLEMYSSFDPFCSVKSCVESSGTKFYPLEKHSLTKRREGEKRTQKATKNFNEIPLTGRAKLGHRKNNSFDTFCIQLNRREAYNWI